MKQLKLDAFFLCVGSTNEGSNEYQKQQDVLESERSVLQAFAEYEDVSQNVFVCRPRKNLHDDFPYCRCEPLADWSLTCASRCENRATQTECVLGHCTTKFKCGNQRMQLGTQVALALTKTPGKGIALMADTNIEKEEFVAQYVGEVISRKLYVDREQKQTASSHSYGMAVTGNEVIDARYVGGMARFANHSCCPNCDVERWEVAGEICCGLFANRTIACGEEITINYGPELVRAEVGGAHELDVVFRVLTFLNGIKETNMKCLCNADNCKGFLQ